MERIYKITKTFLLCGHHQRKVFSPISAFVYTLTEFSGTEPEVFQNGLQTRFLKSVLFVRTVWMEENRGFEKNDVEGWAPVYFAAN